MKTRPLISAALISTVALTLAACGQDGSADAVDEDQTSFTIGVANEHEAHRELARIAEEEYGYEVELVNFTAYPEPNPALAAGDLDANWFQHIAFLAEHNVASGDNLQPIAPTEIVPLTLYSNEYDDVSEFSEGDTVAIPNDPVNQGRAINVLVAAGLVELAEEISQPEPRHVDQEASTVELQPVDAAQTVNALQSVEGSIINNNFAQDADLDPLSDGIYADDPSDPSAFPYINTFVVREADVDNEALQEIASIYHDERVLEIMDDRSNGTSVPVSDVSAEELQEALTDYEDALREGDN
ncbi:MetQ/NlpA family ABC transporter substrate-binding protein [Nesterenkonia sphaerica]|uniref:NLPA lipoprotein n=1 Tax=Nesterenkonia sphaerica TaxID=1804988 RepID=A0A5R9AF15_9MICC|nr:MetQ/NlpA family ABC transporter substrate-binding protein [Nesterenkonia sphaerica]TLP77080.1 NLPA lipoprotein [Nesterenkonia sphaerica]